MPRREKPGEALKAQDSGHFKTVPLSTNSGIVTTDAPYFLQSFIDNTERCLSPENAILDYMGVLDKSKWPVCPSIQY